MSLQMQTNKNAAIWNWKHLFTRLVAHTTWLDLTGLQPSSIRGLVTLRTNCCHPVLCSVLRSISSMFIVIHDVRFPIHDVLGFPLRLPPGRVPWIRSFSRQTSFFLRMCPKYVIYLAFTLANSCLCVPALSRTHSLVFFSVHLTGVASLGSSSQTH